MANFKDIAQQVPPVIFSLLKEIPLSWVFERRANMDFTFSIEVLPLDFDCVPEKSLMDRISPFSNISGCFCRSSETSLSFLHLEFIREIVGIISRSFCRGFPIYCHANLLVARAAIYTFLSYLKAILEVINGSIFPFEIEFKIFFLSR